MAKANRVPKTRTIYDNYNLWVTYPDNELKEMAVECGWINEEEVEEVTDNQLWDWRYQEDEVDWQCEKDMLSDFFEGKTVGFFGKVGRWDGVYNAGKIGEFWKLFNEAITDCNYIRLYDENGHFYLTCSHHDGSCHFEIKEITKEGENYIGRWEDNWDDKRSEEYVHNQIYKRYSKLPEFAHRVYGMKRKEYEPLTKCKIISILNNNANSRYGMK